MKIIFLDIDGVLNSETSMHKFGKEDFFNDNPHPDHIQWLNYIVAKTGAHVVISSTWRIHVESTMMWRFLTLLGFRGKVIGNTPRMNSYRGTEIKMWMLEHADKLKKYKDSSWMSFQEPVESFVILDDDSDMGDLKPYLVQTNSRTGLLECHAKKAVKILNEG